MTTEMMLALALFAFVTSVTPGPNNAMLMASGANFGVRRTVPAMLGVAFGFSAMIALVGAGLMGIFDAVPFSYTVLKFACAGYLLFLAYRIATALPPDSAAARGTPPSFLQAALFQWVNPKAWAVVVTAIGLYAPARTLGAVAPVALVFALVSLPAIGSWTVLGQQLRRLLTSPGRLRLFNLAMALALVGSMVPVLI